MAIQGKPRILSQDLDTGITEYLYYDPDTDGITIHAVQDVKPIMEANKAMYAATDERAGWKGDLHHVASIPLLQYHLLVRQGIITWGGDIKDPGRLSKWLNDNVNRGFRTRPGRV